MEVNNYQNNRNITGTSKKDTGYRPTPELRLFTAVVSRGIADGFYEASKSNIGPSLHLLKILELRNTNEPTNRELSTIVQLIRQVDPLFVAKLAVYARNELQLRAVPLFLVVELARHHTGDNLVSRTIDEVIINPEEIMALLLCYQWRNSRTGLKKLDRLSHQIRSGLQRAFSRFDEQQFERVNYDYLGITLRDALFLVHPKAKDENQQALFDKIANGMLATPCTLEDKAEKLRQQWGENWDMYLYHRAAMCSEMIRNGRLSFGDIIDDAPYWSTLKRILNYNVPCRDISIVAKCISDKHNVWDSRLLPYRFLSAYLNVVDSRSSNTPVILNALEEAARHSLGNIKGFDENSRILIGCETYDLYSAEFLYGYKLNGLDPVRYSDLGILLAMLLQNRCKEVICGCLGSTWERIDLPSRNFLANTIRMRENLKSTVEDINGEKPLEWLIENHIVVDKVMLFAYKGLCKRGSERTNALLQLWNRYKRIAPKARLYVFKLESYWYEEYKPLSIWKNDVYQFSGWSERIFDVINAIDHGRDAIEIVNTIKL